MAIISWGSLSGQQQDHAGAAVRLISGTFPYEIVRFLESEGGRWTAELEGYGEAQVVTIEAVPG